MCDDMQQTLQWMSDALEAAEARAEAAEAKMPCTHPRGCVVSAPHADGMDATSSCGWCASIVRAEAAEKRVRILEELVGSLVGAEEE